jgi:hypothetical protein
MDGSENMLPGNKDYVWLRFRQECTQHISLWEKEVRLEMEDSSESSHIFGSLLDNF